MPNTKVGKRIKHARELRRFSQSQLAQKLGVTKQTISNYENGVRTPDFEMLDSLSYVLNISMAFLVGAVDDPGYYPKPNGDEPSFDPFSADHAEATQAREDLFNDPDRKALLNLAKHGSPEAVRQVAAVIDALKATNPDFYDGDDPA